MSSHEKGPGKSYRMNMCSIRAVRQFSDEDRVERIIVRAHIHRKHEAVNHNVKEFVRCQAQTNGKESFWATFKRGFNSPYQYFAAKHLRRYGNEFAGRHNGRRNPENHHHLRNGRETSALQRLDQFRAILVDMNNV